MHRDFFSPPRYINTIVLLQWGTVLWPTYVGAEIVSFQTAWKNFLFQIHCQHIAIDAPFRRDSFPCLIKLVRVFFLQLKMHLWKFACMVQKKKRHTCRQVAILGRIRFKMGVWNLIAQGGQALGILEKVQAWLNGEKPWMFAFRKECLSLYLLMKVQTFAHAPL